MPNADEIDPDATYTAGEAARLMGVAPSTVVRAISAGRLPATRGTPPSTPPATREPVSWAIRGADLLAWSPQRRPVPATRGSLRKAAAAAGVHENTLRTAIRLGELPADKATGRWLIDADDLTA